MAETNYFCFFGYGDVPEAGFVEVVFVSLCGSLFAMNDEDTLYSFDL